MKALWFVENGFQKNISEIDWLKLQKSMRNNYFGFFLFQRMKC